MSRFSRTMVLVAAALFVTSALYAGPYSGATAGVRYDDPRFVGWATGCTVNWPSGFTPTYNNPLEATGAAPGTPNDVVTLGDCGTALLTFGRAIVNGPGPDLAVFENGFNNPAAPGQLFAELAFVEVSSDGVNFARFPSVSLGGNPGEYGSLDPTNGYNLAGKHINNNDQAYQGTPFDLSDLANDRLVLSGIVSLEHILYVRIVDIFGASNSVTVDEATSLVDPTTGQKYTTNHVIYDGGNFGLQLSGFDLDAVGILEAVLGDANGDGKVDGGDLAVWQQHYDPLGLNAATNGAETGDWNADGKVDGGDLAIWQQNYNPLGITAAVGAVELTAVPEPGCLALLALGVPVAGFLRRRAQRGK